MRKLLWILIVSWVSAGYAHAQISMLRPIRLTADSQAEPMGVGSRSPSLGWNLTAVASNARGLRQSAYRIVLADSKEHLLRPSALLWDSGKTESSVYWQRPYQGPPLQSHTTYFWRVQAWAEGSPIAGPWSDISAFTTGILSDEEWTAHWIAAVPDAEAAKPSPLPVFRHSFVLKKPVASALLFVAGMGQYEVHLNGDDVTKDVLNQTWTDYKKTVDYNTFDVAKLLHPGPNALGVLLGNGMYNVERVKGRYTKFVGSFGQPKCLLQLEVRYRDGTTDRIVSDGSWQTRPGPVVYSSTFGGEDFDARVLPQGWDLAETTESAWRPASVVAGPGGRLAAAQSAPMVVAQIYPTMRKTTPKPGVTVYDLGETMSGWPGITVRGAAGSRVDLLAGELLNPDGTVSQKSANAFPEAPVLYSYILRGNGVESWHPRFSYYSFRYVQVTTAAAGDDLSAQPRIISLTGDFVHAKAPIAGTFESSNELFNKIHVLIDRAVLSNLASVVTDCPSREKLGWLEQTYLNASTLMLNYDVTGLYEKMSDDMRDSQLSNGLVPSIAPEYVAFTDKSGKSSAFRDSPEWGSAVVLSPWALYRYTGDTAPLEKNYGVMQRYVAYLEGRAHDGILDYGLGDWYDIGPGAPGQSQLTSKMVTATGVYYEDLVAMGQIAALLGHAEDAASYAQKGGMVRDAFNRKLFHPDTDEYDRGSQTANALPLALGIVPPEHVQAVLEHLVADIHAHGDHVTAGDVGFHYVVRALTDYGRSDVLAAMLSRTDPPSYGYQLARGATTLTEAWDANPSSSQNHFMLGHGEEWFYRGLAGLSVDMALGVDHAVQVRPSFLGGVNHASASYRGAMGDIRVAWRQFGAAKSVDVTVPPGAQVQLALPTSQSWSEGGRAADRATGVVDSARAGNELHITLGSGTYHFVAAMPARR